MDRQVLRRDYPPTAQVSATRCCPVDSIKNVTDGLHLIPDSEIDVSVLNSNVRLLSLYNILIRLDYSACLHDPNLYTKCELRKRWRQLHHFLREPALGLPANRVSICGSIRMQPDRPLGLTRLYPSREDIEICQSTYGKTILLSIGGATYTEGGFSSSTAAVSAAQDVWAMFGPEQSDSTVDRPFGSAIVDGFDFDFESTTQNMEPFASELRSLMDAATAAGDKQYYLSAAPQCPYPDLADNDMLDGAVSFDFVMVQFYNNYCGVNAFVPSASTQSSFNFDTWDTWAHTISANPDVKVLLGIPANMGAGSGYTSGSTLEAAIQYSETFSSFGGIMMWDMSQLYQNSGFLDEVVSDLGSGGTTTTTVPVGTTTSTATTLSTSTTTVASTTATTTTPVSTGTPVAQWGQCGGNGYTGSTSCASPYSCTCLSVWWCQCE